MILSLTLILGFVVVVQWRASAREAHAAETYPPQGQVIDVDGTPVHVLTRGSGPDLILLHGASGNIRDWTFDFVDHLADRYRVVMFDRPGLGWTDRLPGRSGAFNTRSESPAEQAELLQKAADIVGVDRPIVVGHSFGGIVAMSWALSRPDSTAAVVMLAGVANPWPGSLGWNYTVVGSALGGGFIVPVASAFVPQSYVENSIESIFAPQPAPDGYAEHVGASLTLRRDSLRANAQQVNFLRPHVVEMSARYPDLTLPVEIVHGDADTIVPMEIHAVPLSSQVPGAVLTTLEGVGHMPHHADPGASVAAIDRAAARAGLRNSD